MQFAMDDSFKTVARMKVIGVGGAGGNAINRMVQSGLEGVEFIAINTDAMALDNNLAHVRLQIGERVTGGLGVGADPSVGLLAIEEDREKVKSHLEGADMVFITAGMGGGTGTGAAPIVAQIARELGILTVAVVTKPFTFEGPVRERNAQAGLEALRSVVDTIIVIPNQKLLSIIDRNTTFRDAFRIADEVLTSATRGISDIILKHGDIQVDFNDVKTIMRQGGDALMGSGVGRGENRAIEAAERAIRSPLLDDVSISGATGVLVNISGGEDLGMLEINDAMNHIYQAIGLESNPNIIFGTVITPELKEELRVTVIATGFGQSSAVKYAMQNQTLLNFPDRKNTRTNEYRQTEFRGPEFRSPEYRSPDFNPSNLYTNQQPGQATSMPRADIPAFSSDVNRTEGFTSRMDIPERPRFDSYSSALSDTRERSVLPPVPNSAPYYTSTPENSEFPQPNNFEESRNLQAPSKRITNRMESVNAPMQRMDSLDTQALRQELRERGTLFNDDIREDVDAGNSEKSRRTTTSFSTGSASEGRYREAEVDVDYETPAFLRYQGD